MLKLWGLEKSVRSNRPQPGWWWWFVLTTAWCMKQRVRCNPIIVATSSQLRFQGSPASQTVWERRRPPLPQFARCSFLRNIKCIDSYAGGMRVCWNLRDVKLWGTLHSECCSLFLTVQENVTNNCLFLFSLPSSDASWDLSITSQLSQVREHTHKIQKSNSKTTVSSVIGSVMFLVVRLCVSRTIRLNYSSRVGSY